MCATTKTVRLICVDAADAVKCLYGSFCPTSLPSRLLVQPIQNCADGFCGSCSTLMWTSLNFQKPFPLKKYVLPEGQKTG
jgi:hypothetical protein